MNGRPPNNIPLIGQQRAQAEAGIMQAAQQLSLTIYTPSAIAYIAGRDDHQEVDTKRLEQMARDSQTAAQTFFETLAGVQFKKPESPG